MESIRLNAKEILDKEFRTSIKGYNKDDVDQFLDIIIRDYEIFEEKIKELEKELMEAKRQKQLSQTTAHDPERTTRFEKPMTGATNYDILRRLSKLEKEVFGKKLYD